MTDIERLVAFLLARIDDDEQVAHRLVEAYERDELRPPANLINYQALVDPARVLADCAARRQIIELHQRASSDLYPEETLTWCSTCSGQGWPCDTLLVLAQQFRAHSGFDPAWATD